MNTGTRVLASFLVAAVAALTIALGAVLAFGGDDDGHMAGGPHMGMMGNGGGMGSSGMPGMMGGALTGDAYEQMLAHMAQHEGSHDPAWCNDQIHEQMQEMIAGSGMPAMMGGHHR